MSLIIIIKKEEDPGKMRQTAFVKEVIDGDTFKISSNEVMRLEDVDAPEINSESGRKAKRELEELILNKRIEYEEQARDDYGRLIVQVWVDGTNVNDEMEDFIDSL